MKSSASTSSSSIRMWSFSSSPVSRVATARLTNSGGHLPEPLVRRLRTLFPEASLHLMYGLTEAFRSASLDPALVDVHPDSVGTAIPFAELRIARADGTDAAPGEEAALVSGAVSEAAAFGVADDRLGQAIVLVAVATGADADERLRAHFAAELPAFMRPTRIVLIGQMPLGPNGKVDRTALRAALDEGEPQ